MNYIPDLSLYLIRLVHLLTCAPFWSSQRARERQEKAANANRSPASAYQIGDKVFLDTRNITTTRPIKKLDCKYTGPFQITKIINSHVYKLKLPFEH